MPSLDKPLAAGCCSRSALGLPRPRYIASHTPYPLCIAWWASKDAVARRLRLSLHAGFHHNDMNSAAWEKRTKSAHRQSTPSRLSVAWPLTLGPFQPRPPSSPLHSIRTVYTYMAGACFNLSPPADLAVASWHRTCSFLSHAAHYSDCHAPVWPSGIVRLPSPLASRAIWGTLVTCNVTSPLGNFLAMSLW